MAEPAFRGTLLLLQNRTRRDPESYRDEFLAQLDHFRASSATVFSQRTLNPQFVAVLSYLCHVSHCFPAESLVTVNIVLELLRASKGNGLPSDLRLALVKSLILLRAKNLVSTDQTFPLFFELLQERDKTLRKLILTHVVSDVRRVNVPGTKNGAVINKKAQNFLFSVMTEDDPVQARCAEMVMIDLYRRRVWSDERTVEVLTKACFSKHTTILRTALRFFLLQMPKITSIDDEDNDGEEQDPGRTISKMKQKLKIVKKTSKRERVLKRGMRDAKRRYDRQEREEELFARQHVDPIRLLRDPQQFVERLLAKLQKTSERFEIRLLYLNVIARTVSEHEVIHLPLYGFLERYMEPSQLHATQLLALSAMCVHKMIPPDALEPLLRTIANHFVSDRSSPDAITVGINTIREICKRQPLAMNADLLKDLTDYKNQRGDKGVMMAARALIQLYRDVYPELLPAKLRGNKAGAADMTKKPVYGAEDVYTDIPGLELLCHEEEEGSEDVSSESASDNGSSSGSSGDWATDSDSEMDADDVEGAFVDASEDSSDGAQEDDADPCPQLVPVHTQEGEKEENHRCSPSSDGRALQATEEADENVEAAHKRQRVEKPTEKSEEEEEEEEDDGSDAFGWEEASEDDEDEDEDDAEFEEMEDDEDGEEEEDQENKERDVSLSKAFINAPNPDGDWFEDLTNNSSSVASLTNASVRRQSSVTTSKASAASISSSRILTDSDFEKIRQLQAQRGSHQSLRGKLKEHEARAKKKYNLIHGISNDLNAHDIEHFTERKRETDKQAKIEQAQELRKATSKFELRRKKKSKLNSTHGEHSKRGKLFQMTKRSQRVATKLKSSVADRATRAKEMKKKDVKFRIKRGWKA